MRLVGIDVAEEEIRDVGGLLFGFAAEGAFARLHGFGDGDVALAMAHVGERQGQQGEGEDRQIAGNAHRRCNDYSDAGGEGDPRGPACRAFLWEAALPMAKRYGVARYIQVEDVVTMNLGRSRCAT